MASGYLNKITSLVDDIVEDKARNALVKAKADGKISEYTVEKQNSDKESMIDAIEKMIADIDDARAKDVLEILGTKAVENKEDFITENGVNLDGIKNLMVSTISDVNRGKQLVAAYENKKDESSKNGGAIEENAVENVFLENDDNPKDENLESKAVIKDIVESFKNINEMSEAQRKEVLFDYINLDSKNQRKIEQKILEGKFEELGKSIIDDKTRLKFEKKTKAIFKTLDYTDELVNNKFENGIIGKNIFNFTETAINGLVVAFTGNTIEELADEYFEKKHKDDPEWKAKHSKNNKDEKQDKDKDKDEKQDKDKDEDVKESKEKILFGIKIIRFKLLESISKIKTIEDLKSVNKDLNKARKVFKITHLALKVGKIEKNFMEMNPRNKERNKEFQKDFDYMEFLKEEHRTETYQEFENRFIEAGMGDLLYAIKKNVPLENLFEVTRNGLKNAREQSIKVALENDVKNGVVYNHIIKKQKQKQLRETEGLAHSEHSEVSESLDSQKSSGLNIDEIDVNEDEQQSLNEAPKKIFGSQDFKKISNKENAFSLKGVVRKIKEKMSLRKKERSQAQNQGEKDQGSEIDM